MRRPSFQFYPGDWSANPNLKRCSFAEKGIWLEVMCLMHDQPEYGVLRWSIKEIAEAVKCRTADLQSLVRKGVLKGSDEQIAEPFVYVPRSGRKDGDPVTLVGTQAGPLWYSSRMVKDEYVRVIRGTSDPTNATPKASPKPTIGEGIGPRGSSSSSSNTSEPNGSDADGVTEGRKPAVPLTEDEIIFGYGVPILTAAGSSDKHARSFLAGLRKEHGDRALVDKLRDCMRAKPLQPLEWLAAAMPPKAKAGKHAGFATKDYRQGVEADGSLA